MNSTLFEKNLTTIESWFILSDIFMITCSTLIIVLATLCLCIIILDKTCHTIPMMLIANSYLIAVVLGCILLSFSTFTLDNDFKQIAYPDTLCVIRGYIGYALYTVFNCSFLLQALYRYIIAVYPTRLFWRSFQFQILAIGLTCIYSIVYIVPFIYTGDIIYNSDNQICQLVLRLSFSIIYGACFAYTIPMSLIIIIYVKLVRYVKEMGKNVTAVNTLTRAKRELKMVRRIVIVITILIGVAFPYILIMFTSFFNKAPKYHFRFAYIFVNVSTLSVIIVLFQFTDPLKTSLLKRIHRKPNIVASVLT